MQSDAVITRCEYHAATSRPSAVELELPRPCRLPAPRHSARQPHCGPPCSEGGGGSSSSSVLEAKRARFSRPLQLRRQAEAQPEGLYSWPALHNAGGHPSGAPNGAEETSEAQAAISEHSSDPPGDGHHALEIPSSAVEEAGQPEVAPEQLTTCMMRNLPQDYDRELLRRLIESQGFGGKYDFLYVPYDFRRKAIQGFAFVNLVSPEDAANFREHFMGFQSWGTTTKNCRKVCNVSWAQKDQQGQLANIERFKNSSVMHKTVQEEWKPLLFSKGEPVRFPRSTKQLWSPSVDFGRRGRRSEP